jgi:hypothetical protein
MNIKPRLWLGIAALSLFFVAAVAAIPAPIPTVTKVVTIAKPKRYSGPCPTTIEFVGTIFVSHPARVEYRWERSDGATGSTQTVDIRSAGQGVKDTWRIGTPGKSFSGWVKLHVLAPTGISSDAATFDIRCQ